MNMLVDTENTMNTSNKDYHLWVMSQYLIMIAEYLKCDPNTECDDVRLLPTLDLNVIQHQNTHGQLTDVVHYYTPYPVHVNDPLIISFVLSDEIYLHSVLRLPTLLSMGTTIALQRDMSACSEL